MGQFGFGQAVRRVEDVRLVTGRGRYTDDMTLGRQTYAYMLRSPHAHARIGGIDALAAKAAPGVLGVYTVDDLDADGVGRVPCLAPIKSSDGRRMYMPPPPPLARGHARHVGDAVVIVVAQQSTPDRHAIGRASGRANEAGNV